MRKIVLALAILIPLACLGAVIGYNLPPIHDRLAWRVDEWQSRLKYAIDPPEKAVFVPKDQKSTEIPAPGEPTASPTIVFYCNTDLAWFHSDALTFRHAD